MRLECIRNVDCIYWNGYEREKVNILKREGERSGEERITQTHLSASTELQTIPCVAVYILRKKRKKNSRRSFPLLKFRTTEKKKKRKIVGPTRTFLPKRPRIIQWVLEALKRILPPLKLVLIGWVLWHINHCRLFNAKSSLYICIKYIWFGWVLWHINHCRLFYAKSSLYICIKYIKFGLVGFYGISTIVGYLMPNSFYTYILNILDLVWFYGISNIVGYLMANPLYTYTLNI